MPAYDVIGDVHGRADLLIELLIKLGYQPCGDSYFHPQRSAVFIGDLIDNGPQQTEVLALVRAMESMGRAKVIMGNHEYNAVCYATRDPDSPKYWLRPHNEKNMKQHQGFIDAFKGDNQAYWSAIHWLRQLPVFLELDGARFVHACWHQKTLDKVKPLLGPNNEISHDLLVRSAKLGNLEYDAFEILLKGPEMTLPEGHNFFDKYGNTRCDIRVKWWRTQARTYRDLALVPLGQEENVPSIDVKAANYSYLGKEPVFIGHYWLQGRPGLQTSRVACVDYSADGRLVAYRWDGETELSEDKFVSVG